MLPLDGLAAAMRVRDARIADPLSRNVGGPLPDPRWDAWFGALQQQEDAAHASGMNFRFNPAGLNVPTVRRS